MASFFRAGASQGDSVFAPVGRPMVWPIVSQKRPGAVRVKSFYAPMAPGDPLGGGRGRSVCPFLRPLGHFFGRQGGG